MSLYDEKQQIIHSGRILLAKNIAMKKWVLVVGILSCGCSLVHAQHDMDAILRLTGSDGIEELDADEIERLADLMERPVRINQASSSVLIASGLFGHYRVVSLIDYITRHGDVMSLTELAGVDGFGEDFVSRVAPFISLEGGSLQQRPTWSDIRNDLAVKGAFRHKDQPPGDWSYGMKYRLQVGCITAAVSASRSYDCTRAAPDYYSGSIAYDFEKLRTKVVAGDFHARFGQGLTLWSGAFMTSLNAPSAFMKKPSGITGTWSFTGSSALTGIASETAFDRLRIAALVAFPQIKDPRKPTEIMPVGNITWLTRSGHVAATYARGKISSDAAFCLRGVNIFGEAAYDLAASNPALLCGTEFSASERLRLAGLLRYIPDDIYGAAFSGEFKTSGQGSTGTFSIDAICYPMGKGGEDSHSMQVKSLLNWDVSLAEGVRLKVRLSERLRSWGYRFRTDLRADLSYESGAFYSAFRANGLHCAGLAFVGYAEQGLRAQKVTMYLRQGVFFVDDWEDRIYVYERDAPGSFNVPAMYGRGWMASLVLSARLSRSRKCYFRLSRTSYSFMPEEKRKPGKTELKLQYVFRF